jgi:hypothetical protein
VLPNTYGKQKTGRKPVYEWDEAKLQELKALYLAERSRLQKAAGVEDGRELDRVKVLDGWFESNALKYFPEISWRAVRRKILTPVE